MSVLVRHKRPSVRLVIIPGFVLLLLGILTLIARAAPPATPPITEPAVSGQIVNPGDVHMEAGPFFDPDGDNHYCTDWEIWTVAAPERVWYTACITGVEVVHTHLGDGVFENSHAGRTELLPDSEYQLRVRFRDDSPAQEWSAYATRNFVTGAASQVFPLEMDDVLASPAPQWVAAATTAPIVLPAGAPPPTLLVSSPPVTISMLLSLSGLNGVVNQVDNPPPLAEHVAVRLQIAAGNPGVPLALPESDLIFTDQQGIERTLYLPSVNITPTQSVYLWVAINGATFWGTASQTAPDFSNLARGAPVPWEVLQPGYTVEVVATGFQLPVNIAFVPAPGPDPDDPLYYVTELYGTIKVVTRNGTVRDYATNLLNFNPTGVFPGSGEQGLTGIVVDPATGDVYASLLYSSIPFDDAAPHYPRVVRFQSLDGLTAITQTTMLDMPGETQGQSHQISNLTIGPDGKLYVHMGDGFTASTALNLDSFRGKILRLNLDGTVPASNPFYDAGNGLTARDYVFAYGFRNPFGGAWRASDGAHYEVENGPSSNDRFAKVTAGASYGWDGSAASMTINALYNWASPVAPVNIAFIQGASFGGSGFPLSKHDHAFVTESGPTWATGVPARGKKITEFGLDGSGNVVSGPTPLLQYNGIGKASVAALAAGPDGLYFSDLYKDLNYSSPIDPGANILRVRYVGTADFTATVTNGTAPLTTTFQDLSDVAAPSAWRWDFGNGLTSTLQHPTVVYTTSGAYTVSLQVAHANGIRLISKPNYVLVGQGAGLTGQYFNFTGGTPPVNAFDPPTATLALMRLDPVITYTWSSSPGAPVSSDFFSVRWSGLVEPQFTEVYTFYTQSDDGVRLWVNGALLVNNWTDHSSTENSGTLALIAGQKYPLVMEFYDRNGGAVARLSWASPSQPKQVIPQPRLFPAVDLLVGNAAPSTIPAGSVLSYTVSISNTGFHYAANTQVTITLPSQMAFLSASAGCAPAGLNVICAVGTLSSGQSKIVAVQGTVPLTATGTLTASVTSTSEMPDLAAANNTVTAVTTVTAPQSNLTVTTTDGRTAQVPGTSVVYTTTVTNQGPSPIVSATVTNTLPAALIGAAWVCTPSGLALCGASAGSGNLNTQVSLPSGSAVSFVFSGAIPSSATGSLTNTAAVTLPGGWTDPSLGDNAATDTSILTPISDVGMTLAVSPTLMSPLGGVLTYTLVVSNSGPSNAVGVVLTHTLPPGTSFQSAVPVQTQGPNPLQWDLGALAVGNSQVITVVATAPPGGVGPLISSAGVASATGDPETGNNARTATTAIEYRVHLPIIAR